jgi:hypothetical protein
MSRVRGRCATCLPVVHSNGDLRNSIVAGRLSMFATCGMFPWKAPAVCVALCAVLLECYVLFYVICVFLGVVSYCSTLPPGKNPFAIQLNNNNNSHLCLKTVGLNTPTYFLISLNKAFENWN